MKMDGIAEGKIDWGTDGQKRWKGGCVKAERIKEWAERQRRKLHLSRTIVQVKWKEKLLRGFSVQYL